MKNPTRRETLLTGLFGSAGALGLRALATGLPAWFLANPRKASAQDMTCAISNMGKAQFLIVAASSAGDAHSCNCPGTYTNAAIIHPAQTEMASTDFMLGTAKVTAAKPWSALTAPVLARTNFFHHLTGGTVHGDHPKVMKLLGRTAGGEMWPSIYAKHLFKCLGTVQPEPVSVGTGGNALEAISFQGRTLPNVTPLQLKQLLTGSKTDPVVMLRTMRDTTLDQLNALFKADGTPEQGKFLDAMAASQSQVRELATSLATTLNSITVNSVAGQALAAAALIAAKVTPVVTLHIPFGADNHTDADLYDEWFDHTDHDSSKRGVPGIQAVMDAVASLNLTDQVTFATMNVFGRDLSGTSKVTSRGGRDHFGNHSVMVMIGKNVNPGVTGGAVLLSGSVYGAGGIDSATGNAVAGGGDIAVADTHVSAAKTLGVALGIDSSLLKADFTDNGAVKVANTALSGVTG
ncbi:MAG TPA: DUF1501 domain-containing protein [Polyangia bacterium]|jgi:hypothetical protein